MAKDIKFFSGMNSKGTEGSILPETVKLGCYKYHNDLVFVRETNLPDYAIVAERYRDLNHTFYTKGEKLPKSMEFLAANYDSDEVQAFMRGKRK